MVTFEFNFFFFFLVNDLFLDEFARKYDPISCYSLKNEKHLQDCGERDSLLKPCSKIDRFEVKKFISSRCEISS